MLGKLLKYDFKSIGRSMFPVYLLTVALSVILSVMVRMRVDYTKAFTAALILFVSLVVGSTIGTVVLLNQRFTRGLLGILMPKSSEDLLEYVNTFIAAEKESGRIDELADEYIYGGPEEEEALLPAA